MRSPNSIYIIAPVRFGIALFSVPAHRTGLADLPHLAFGEESRFRRRRSSFVAALRPTGHSPPIRLNWQILSTPAVPSMVVVGSRGWRRIRPSADPDEENRRPFFGIIRGHHRRARQIGSPTFRSVTRNKKHQVRMPVFGFVTQVLLL